MKKSLLVALILVVALNLIVFVIFLSPSREKPEVQPDSPYSELLPELQNPSAPTKPSQVLPSFVSIAAAHESSDKSVYGDVMSHSRERPFGDKDGRATNVHETNHGLNSWIRSKYMSETGKKVNGFYVLDNRGVVIDEPRFRKSQVVKFLPKNLQSYRYSMYITGQAAWDDTPLYICDEWVAYVNAAKCNVQDVQTGRYKGGWTDGVSGSLEFSIYSIALAMAIKEHDPQVWSNGQFRNFMIWMLHEANQVFMIGRSMDQFKWDKQDRLLREFLTSSAAEPMRKFVQENLEGVWLDIDAEPLKVMHYESYQTYNTSHDPELRMNRY